MALTLTFHIPVLNYRSISLSRQNSFFRWTGN